MNSLSWLIYLADVCGSISATGTTIAILSFLGGIAATIAVAMKVDFDNIGEPEKRPVLQSGWQAGKKFFIVAGIAAAVVSPIPSSNTIYAIAASEMGEEALKSKTAGKAIQALDAWLDKQLVKTKGE